MIRQPPIFIHKKGFKSKVIPRLKSGLMAKYSRFKFSKLKKSPSQSENILPSPPSFSNIEANLIVSQDGTGDTDSVEEAIKIANDGDIIYVSFGTYKIKNDLDILKSVVIIGSGIDTILDFTNKEFVIGILGSPPTISKVILTDMTIQNYDAFEVYATMDILMLQRVNLAYMQIDPSSDISALYIMDCLFSDDTEFNNSDMAMITGNIFQGDLLLDNNYAHIYNNRLGYDAELSGDKSVFCNNISPDLTSNIVISGDWNIVMGNIFNLGITDSGANNVIANNIDF